MQIGEELWVQTDCILDSILVREAPVSVLLEENSKTGVSVEALGGECVLEGVKRCVFGGSALVDLFSNLIETSFDALFLLLNFLLLSAVVKLFCVSKTGLMAELRGDVGGIESRNHWL